ncbi:MAG TPA: quinohemoprotein amine dehydrogenase maturation protein [Blastocatellia bacterium]|nr:quinohemoprotein amine dehydrogenase maturation protein [Blastocatellia bacterium]HMX24847.1 quinohemoprotein amine dehydrogenase maturation protein [Blastocatellia bacterium]HMZ18013.1 quinohemoprotein amine dehydrogenase maturation protein [Blastocatellia bacterium]HNG29980.1 quinohemoprotein amine dehydrogenase maturation protein [Blastocatellia bacterium]
MTTLRLGEFHEFSGGGQDYLYLVPSGAIFALDELSSAVIQTLRAGERERLDLVADLTTQGFNYVEAEETVAELYQSRALTNGHGYADEVQPAPMPFPLQTLVLNVTNQCNLSCKYCYEFGEDRLAMPEGKTKFMDEATAFAAVDFLLAQSPGRRAVHLTFFGGETLMNFKVVRATIDYARQQAHAAGKYIDFSLTTNATLLTEPVIEYLAEQHVGVTISIDGPQEMNDQLRVFSNGQGSYEMIAPKIKALLAKHRTRPIAARVTLTSQVVDVKKIYRHLKDELGFHEVGFAPVTTSPVRLYAIGTNGLNSILEQFTALAEEYLECALRNEHHGFSNVSDTLAELHAGISKAHPCGAGLGLLGVSPSGDIAPCHRFVDADAHKLGTIQTGIDRAQQADFLERGHINRKPECLTCWARPVCSGGCYHEAFVRYGDTGQANLHYCDWIRGWTDVCLRVYGELATRNPQFLAHFDERKTL